MNLPGFENVKGLTAKAKSHIGIILSDIKTAPHRVTSFQLEGRYGIVGSEVRAIINHLRRIGELVGSDHGGYYYCETWEEVSQNTDSLYGRYVSIMAARNGMIEGAKKAFGQQTRCL